MPYATQQDLIDRADAGAQTLIELTDRADPPTGEIDATVVGRALEDADAVIEPHLQGRYTLPLVSAPKLITRIACDIAIYDLYGSRANEGISNRYKDAMKLLASIAKGDLGIGLDAVNAPTPIASGGAQASSVARVFGSDALADYGNYAA